MANGYAPLPGKLSGVIQPGRLPAGARPLADLRAHQFISCSFSTSRPPVQLSWPWFSARAARDASRRRRRMVRKVQLGCFGSRSALSRSLIRQPDQKAAAHGRSAPAVLRMPPRTRCRARRLCSGAPHTSHMRRTANNSEGSRPALAAESLRNASDHAAGRQ
jgi:hypothetical protein